MYLSPKSIINKSSSIYYIYGANRSFFFLQFLNSVNSQIYKIKLCRIFLDLFLYKNNQIFFLSNFIFLKTIFHLIIYKSKDLIKGFFLELDIKGLGYYIFLKNNYLVLDLNYSHFIGLNVPFGVLLKKFKTKLVLFGFNRERLVNFANIILKLKKIDIYKGKGLFVRGVKFKLKEIKKK